MHRQFSDIPAVLVLTGLESSLSETRPCKNAVDSETRQKLSTDLEYYNTVQCY